MTTSPDMRVPFSFEQKRVDRPMGVSTRGNGTNQDGPARQDRPRIGDESVARLAQSPLHAKPTHARNNSPSGSLRNSTGARSRSFCTNARNKADKTNLRRCDGHCKGVPGRESTMISWDADSLPDPYFRYIVPSDEQRQTNNQQQPAVIRRNHHPLAGRLPSDPLPGKKHDVTSIEDRNGHEVDNRRIDAQHCQKLNEEPDVHRCKMEPYLGNTNRA